jgi:Asp-tRNA(Asn)/Glu-tRNA(Gln) amidotransferase B subunit
MQWDIVIGLEIHVQLATRTKIFSGSSTAYGAEPNTQASLVDLAMPGALRALSRACANDGEAWQRDLAIPHNTLFACSHCPQPGPSSRTCSG